MTTKPKNYSINSVSIVSFVVIAVVFALVAYIVGRDVASNFTGSSVLEAPPAELPAATAPPPVSTAPQLTTGNSATQAPATGNTATQSPARTVAPQQPVANGRSSGNTRAVNPKPKTGGS
jgi:hypothetical protein